MTIKSIPALLYGEKSDRLFLFVHGKMGSKADAENFAQILCAKGFQVLGFDLPGHGGRKDEIDRFVPWKVVPELQDILSYCKQNWQRVSLCANSIGAYFSLLAFADEVFDNCLFVSPVLDMVCLIEDMMSWASVSEKELQISREIPTSFGETLSWDYYTYAKQHRIQQWNSPTAILYAGKDNLTSRETVTKFSEDFGCRLTVYEEGEHWFHTEEQLTVLRKWVRDETATQGLSVYAASSRDIPDWLTLVESVAEDFPGLDIAEYTKTLERQIARKSALIARIDGTIAGVLLFLKENNELAFLAVAPAFRRYGVASALIAEMLRLMPQGDITVTTYREDDPKGGAARALYRKFGFVPEEELTEFGYPVQRFVLHRDSRSTLPG